MLTVHHLNQSRSKRVLWLLEELEMPYQKVDHQRDAQTHLAPASLKAVHPLSKAPVIVDRLNASNDCDSIESSESAESEIILCESSTIMEYILDKNAQNPTTDKILRPKTGTKEYYQYLEWSHFAEGSLAMPVMFTLFMGMENRNGDQPMDGYVAKEVGLDFSYIESTLAQREYFAGSEFTAADIMMTIILEIAASNGLLKDHKKTQAYLAKVQQRPAYQKAASFG